MKTSMIRHDDYLSRKAHLEGLTDQQLKDYFWRLVDQAVTPLVDLAKTHTSPAIERSILLRMGFSSLEAKALVDKSIAYGLIKKGAGHVVTRYSLITNLSIREAGLKLIEIKDWSTISFGFGGKQS
ncbi:MAG: ornithine aminomutase subunit alpha [Candidatus Izemoplasmatales bacterium]|nr:ornithine aminomutase subunit alpha [Candidatus Izemoplasmatales bacterium]MDD4987520.1 ornithine aminomutase subunit alpha [Candidatus Izemoplasmatales bacterium]MDY0372749.1 ornithine aminomutase subunit alpha [Candidatus Izemoplasmatales bacterium]